MLRKEYANKPTLKQIRRRLEWVKEQILAAPERFNQSHWGPPSPTAPCTKTCGTVGCIAGWLDVHRNGFKQHAANTYGALNDTVIKEALKHIGLEYNENLNSDDQVWLFSPSWTEKSAYDGSKIQRVRRSYDNGVKDARAAAVAIDLYLNEIGA